MTKSVEALYRDYLQRAGDDPDAADYLALHQGREGTSRRHSEVLKVLTFEGARMLDIACGTGLLLDEIVRRGQRPGYYLGVDLLPEREPHVKARLEKYGIKGEFRANPPGVELQDVIVGEFDVAVAIGLCGFEGFARPDEIKDLILLMQKHAPHGGVTVPGLVDGRGQHTGYCECHLPHSLLLGMGLSGLNVSDWGWDFLIWW